MIKARKDVDFNMIRIVLIATDKNKKRNAPKGISEDTQKNLTKLYERSRYLFARPLYFTNSRFNYIQDFVPTEHLCYAEFRLME